MKVQSFQTINDFLTITEKPLLQNESFYNLKLGLGESIRQNKIKVQDPLYIAVFHHDSFVGCALRTHVDKPLAISQMPKEAVNSLIHSLNERDITLAGVIGELETTNFFKEEWLKYHPLTFKLNIHLGIYEVRELIFPKEEGHLILATIDQKDLIFNFVKGFTRDCFPHKEHKDEEIEEICIRHLNNKSLYLLKNVRGGIVSMAANPRSSINGGTIGLVYTPPELRGKGYASLVTAKVSEIVLREKKFANLFTDLTNPTSNSIYQKIGYEMIGENIHYDFI